MLEILAFALCVIWCIWIAWFARKSWRESDEWYATRTLDIEMIPLREDLQGMSPEERKKFHAKFAKMIQCLRVYGS